MGVQSSGRIPKTQARNETGNALVKICLSHRGGRASLSAAGEMAISPNRNAAFAGFTARIPALQNESVIGKTCMAGLLPQSVCLGAGTV
jgi:hypothetical protein